MNPTSLSAVWLLFLLLVAMSWWATGRVIHWAHRRALFDLPGQRRSHGRATPTGGGLAFVAVWLLAVLPLTAAWPTLHAVWWMTGMLALLGWVDDLKGLSVRFRLLVQFAAAAVLLWSLRDGLVVRQLLALWYGLPAGLLLVATVWYVNAFNFMDGIDGIAVQQGAFTMAVLAWLGWSGGQPQLFWPAVSMLAVLLGFLPHNRSPARLFMGDAGSLPLGFISVVLTLLAWESGLLNAAASLMLLAVFNMDAFLTLVKRWFSNKRCYTPHREHLYQWLVRSGYSHMQVTAMHALVNVVVVLPLTLWLNRMEPARALSAFVLISLLWACCWWYIRHRLLFGRRHSGT